MPAQEPIRPANIRPPSGESFYIQQFLDSTRRTQKYIRRAARRAQMRPADRRLSALDAPWRHRNVQSALKQAERNIQIAVVLLDNAIDDGDPQAVFTSDNVAWLKEETNNFIQPVRDCIAAIDPAFIAQKPNDQPAWVLIAFRWLLDMQSGAKKMEENEKRLITKAKGLAETFDVHAQRIESIIDNMYRQRFDPIQ